MFFNRKDWQARQAIYKLAKQLEDKRNGMTKEQWVKQAAYRLDGMRNLPNDINERAIVYVRLITELVATLEDVNEFLDNYVDVVDGEDGQPVANKAMNLQATIQDVLKRANGSDVQKPWQTDPYHWKESVR